MIDLVFWSFVIVLAPVALALAWSLISGVGDLIGLGLSRAFEGAEQRRPLRPLSLTPPPGSFWANGRTPSPGTGRFLTPKHRGPY